jgi:hypothetical protein
LLLLREEGTMILTMVEEWRMSRRTMLLKHGPGEVLLGVVADVGAVEDGDGGEEGGVDGGEEALELELYPLVRAVAIENGLTQVLPSLLLRPSPRFNAAWRLRCREIQQKSRRLAGTRMDNHLPSLHPPQRLLSVCPM